jgi:hypothetical protein
MVKSPTQVCDIPKMETLRTTALGSQGGVNARVTTFTSGIAPDVADTIPEHGAAAEKPQDNR